MKKLFFLALSVFSGLSQAAAPSTVTQREILNLFSYLSNSGCQFNRNGTWYAAKEAVVDLNKKYQSLLKKNQITTAESFIKKAASESVGGKPYLVKCGNAEAAHSDTWFRAELARYRKALR